MSGSLHLRGIAMQKWHPAKIHSVSILILLIVCTAHCQELSFTQESYDVVIPENSLGKVYAVPSDLSTKMGLWLPSNLSQSLHVRFKIRSGDDEGFFKAEAEQVGDFVFLLIRTKTNNLDVLNRERRDFYELDIRTRVKDKDNRKRLKLASEEASTIVRVTVKDVNDLDPFFQPSEYAFTVPEDTALHQSVGQVHADDADEGINGEIYFSLMDPKSSFAVHPVTGVVSLTRPLSYQKKPRHEITVVAQDRGAKSRFATRAPDTATLHLSVRQVNLHDPSIQVQHLPEIIEKSNADIYAIVRVEDPDEGRHGEVATLEIVDGDPEAHFRIRQPSIDEPNEFNIEVLRLLDREVSPYGYNLTLKATDKGYPPRASYKDVHVRLADLNDHAPVFDREIYEVRVNESVPINTPILRLKATDQDQGSNAKVTLSIVAGNKDGHFRINPESGVLYLERPLDAEVKSTFSLTVTALDHANAGMRKQSSAKVHLYIVDVNDNDPQFTDGNYREVNFEENRPAGSPVYTVKAFDKDSGENGYISYSIANLDSPDIPFEIDDFSGQIKSKRLLDYESDRRIYHLKIRASDWGLPYRRQSEMRLTIRLLDINDNRPQFERIGCIGDLDRDLISPGANVFTLSALDFDAGNIINYRFVSGSNADGCFSLDAHKGTLTVMCDLRTLPMTSRTLNVTATDGEHFSDVTPIVLNFKSRSNYNLDDFRCRETDVASRLTDLMAKSERNNAGDNLEDFHLSSSLPSRFGSNIHPPEIRDLPSEISVKETAEIGTRLLKVNGFDRDLGFNGDLLYVISNGDYDSVFKIDTYTGELLIDAKLDRETTSDYLLNITVQDQGIFPKFTSKLLHIIVEDVNDNAPQFIKSTFSFFFPENTPKGTPVVTLNASDPDLGLFGQVQYSLESNCPHFSLNPQSGLLSVAAELDREAKEFYDLTIKAQDGDPNLPLASYARVKVRVLDVNDVEPQFTSRVYKLKAREDLPLGTVIGSVEATDPDLYQGGHVKYSLKHDSDNQFFIDELSGTIRIKKGLDFETKQFYNLTVKATDEGSPPLTSFANVLIEVIDVNENLHPPRFNTPFTQASVPENRPIGTLVTSVEAYDADGDKITYSIKGGNGLGEFYIDEDGNIKTLVMLDREVQDTFWLVVMAQDHGAVPLASRLDIYIKVLDVNDNVPMTEHPVYHTSIVENSKPWTPILKLEATDLDVVDPKGLTFQILSGNPQSLFSIDETSGLISTTTRMLDREAQAEHVLEIMVSDNGIPPLNSTTRVIVNVTDENDNKPEFLEKFQKVTLLAWLPETMTSDLQNDDNSLFLLDNDPNGNMTDLDANMLEDFENNFETDQQWEETLDKSLLNPDLMLFRPLAYDRDAGQNGQLLFSLKSSKPGLFQIDQKSGIVYATRGLVDPDAEYQMLIKATDRGQKGLFSLSRVSLTLYERPMANQSMHPPRLLEKTSRVQIFETDPIGHLVALLYADDKDGDKLFYSISDGDPNHHFYINPDKGNLVVASKLDSRAKNIYNLTIDVTDGVEVAQAQIVIDVLPVHRQRPEFEQDIFKAEINENEAIGHVLTKIRAKSKVTFGLHSAQNPLSLTLFKIHPESGEVSLREKLDMEMMRRHVLIVVIKDSNSKDNFARLIIDVLDDNDHEPKFMADIIQTRLPDNAGLGSAVVQVQAYDSDHGMNGELRYSIIHGNKDDTFVIDPVLGNVILAKEMDEIETEFMLMVRASDQNIDDKKSATIPVHILVTSADQDVAPRFSKSHFSVEVKENVPKGSMILHAEAFGASALFYEIQHHPDDIFRVNPSTGHIVNQWPLDFERVNFFNFSVAVTNSLGTKVTASVHIHILDVNDNAPSFNASHYKGHISETASTGSLILKSGLKRHHPLVIQATDKDSGINALLSYQILDAEANRFFAIDESTGALRTIADLDYEAKNRFEFQVRVSDRGTPQLTSDAMAKVTIDVDDENDSPPQFETYPSEATLLLPTFAGVPVAQVHASDPDEGLNATLKFTILGGNDEGMFKIDQLTGVVKVAKESSRTERSQYNLDISVTDGKFNDRKLLTINVENSDNSGLAFAKSRYFASVLENSTKADVLVILTVLGADLNEDLQFSILNLEDDSLFKIGATSGALRTTGKPFDREVRDNYQLVIEVRSEAGRRNVRVAHVIVDIDVLDMNDNAPTFVNLPYFAIVQRSMSSKDASVIKVHAIDADHGQNGDIYYQLVKGNGELFRVGRKSGLITLRSDINVDENNEYVLTIAAYDGGTPPYSAEVVVVIKVVDESIPLFDKQLYTAQVREDVELFTPLLNLKASSPILDESTERPHNLIFSIEAGNEATDLFYIDPDTGMMTTVGKLDYESKRHHQLRVRATDSLDGGYSETIVLFEVEDVNDCQPLFEHPLYRISVSEATSVGKQILKVSATDADGPGENSQIEFSLVRSAEDNELSLFNIDRQTGDISLRSYLDRERKSEHILTILAIDKGSRPLSSQAKVIVTVLDANDNAPSFEELEYNVRLSDQASKGQFVTVVRAIDADENAHLSYGIVGGNDGQVFSVGQTDGIIRLDRISGFDQNSHYKLNLSVTDGVFSAFAKLKIGLISANSHAPVFDQDTYEVEFSEGQPEGVRVAEHIRAVDLDRSDSITYSIQSDNLLQMFSIDSLTGEVWSRHMFDREFKSSFEIPVMATDMGGRSGFTSLVVHITDVNDNHPQFELEEYKANVFANLTRGTPVVQVRANDADEGHNAELKYSIYNDKDDKHIDIFEIDSKNGVISVKKNLNKDLENQVFQFFVRAQDKGRPFQLHSDVPVEIYIMSQLDRPPVFIKRDTVYYIRENSPIGRVITQLEATVELEDSQLRYKIASAAYTDQQLFQIDQMGRVIISGRLDRETKAFHQLTFLAETQTSPTLNAYFEINVQVLDINDNAPEFQSDPYDVAVSEALNPGTQIVQVKATDMDSGNNGEVRYHLEHHLFTIDTHSGWIRIMSPLDAELEMVHELIVKAEDGNGLSALTTVRVNVQDVNDNPHQFSQIHYTAAVNEGALPGNIVFKLMTEDADQVAKTKVEYRILEGDPNGQFGIKSNGDVFVSKPLDRERQSIYKIRVVAADGTFVTKAKVTIEILDDNDNPPECLKSSYTLKISEDTRPGFFLAKIEVTDKDEGINAKQIFYLSGENSDFFHLDKDSGSLKTQLPLDRELISQFELRAHAQDSLFPEWECVSEVVIDITDVNDNAPVFGQDVFTASMKEDTPISAIVTKIHATDADGLPANKKIDYKILDSDHFTIDPDSGIVRLAKELDREVEAMYNVTIRATDQGRPRLSQTTSLVILVLDVNDNPPEFASRLYFASVKEDVSRGTDVVRVMATSKDSGVNADITYSIVAGNEARKFEIHPKIGMIKVQGTLDHETSTTYFLTIQAQDGGDPPLSNHATVNITVLDVNDNSPVFSQVSYSAMINEAAIKSESIVTVRAFDADSGENGNVMYTIKSGDQRQQFKIDSRKGIISVANGDLDREMISSYVLEIEAADHGTPVKSSTVLVNVAITDTNDNPPVFAEDNYTVYVQEDKPFDHIVARFSVTDSDIDPNGSPFTFDIRSGNEDNAFRVVQHDGTLRTATKFNHQIRNRYQLQIRAFDNGSPPLFSDVLVTVNVIEESQYPPIIVPMTVEVKSYQDDFPGAMIGRVKASDQDPYDQLSYDLVQDNGLFDIDHSKGTIIALEGLDVGIYNLNISVNDGKFTSYGEAMVTVDLVDDEMLADSVIMRIASVNPEDFVLSYQKAFVKTIKNILNVRTSDVVILSVQTSPLRSKRDEKRALPESDLYINETIEPELEVLFMVRKNKNEYVVKEKIKNLLKNKLNFISKQLGLTVLEIQEDECTPNHCQHGVCQDQVLMDETAMVSVTTDVISFVGPRHSHAALCLCDQGYAGQKCDQMMNECAKKPCPDHKLCVPLEDTQPGYKCTCPAGMMGEMCNVDITTCGEKCKKIVNPMTFGHDKSLAKFKMTRSIERHLNVQFNMRTLWSAGVIFESSGQVDYAILEVEQGKLKFRFNFGSGEGLVMISSIDINDGHWHQVSVERHGNSAKLVIDNKYEAQGSAPGINDALDNDGFFYFGNNKLSNRGFEGCLDNLQIDDIPLPVQDQPNIVAELVEFRQVEFKCAARLETAGICNSQPCMNGGICLEKAEGGYICQCSERYQGAQCQVDLDPCLSNPCLHGAKCVNLNNDFHCECPSNLSGKRCHYGQYCNPNPCQNGGLCEESSSGAICQCRGFTGVHCSVDINECLRQNPCHNGGTCINTLGSFKCQCPSGTLGPYCHGQSPVTDQKERDYAFKLEELVGIIASLFGLVLIVFLWVMCRKFKVVKTSRASANARTSYHIQNDFDKESIQLRSDGTKLNNLENDLYAQRPLITPPNRVIQQETSFNYVDTVRSYGSAADELESLPPTRLTSHDYLQSIQKPMAAVAPSVINQEPYGATAMLQQRNMLDYYPNKAKLTNVEMRSPLNQNGPRPNSFKPLKVNLPTLPTDSPGLKGATSLSSLPTSTAEDTPKYFWDSFDLNNGEGGESNKHMNSEVAANPADNASFVSGESSGERSRLLPSNGTTPASIDPTRDIETLPEDIQIATMPRRPAAPISNADTEEEAPLGTVFPKKPVSTSFEQLLALNDDINFADEEDESPGAELPNSYDYHLHLNSYLPTYNMSENSETDEQTPMLDRRQILNQNLDVSSEFNASIRALPEDKYSSPLKPSQSGDDNLCQLEETDDDEDVSTPVVENKPPLGLAKITQV